MKNRKGWSALNSAGAVGAAIQSRAAWALLRRAGARRPGGGFLLAGEPFLKILGLDKRSFAVGGSIVIFILGLEMVLGHEFFKSDKDARAGTVVPIAFPLIAGSGTLTTIMSLKAIYQDKYVLAAILINLLIVFIVLKSLNFIRRLLGEAGMIAVRKFFGVVLLAIAVKIFATNPQGLFK